MGAKVRDEMHHPDSQLGRERRIPDAKQLRCNPPRAIGLLRHPNSNQLTPAAEPLRASPPLDPTCSRMGPNYSNLTLGIFMCSSRIIRLRRLTNLLGPPVRP